MQRSIVLISQVYSPDPAAVGRLMSDVGTLLASRQHQVTVFTSSRGYDNPAVRYQSLTTPEGVVIKRLPFCSFGKRSMALRVLAGLSFTLQAALRTLLMRGVDGVVVTTAPPMGGLAGVLVSALRRLPVVYWAMDLNPDQTLALKLATRESIAVRLLESMNRAILRRASKVVALDRFMAERLNVKHHVSDKLAVIPPWGEEDDVKPIAHAQNPFREKHGLQGKTVVMYSGTLGPSNPVDTLLDAAQHFEADPSLVFVFVGGGTGMRAVRERNRPNIVCLPYEPLERMRYSLAAADVHVVSLGPEMVGIVHPCKVYGAMATARPILFLGPDQSHVSDMMQEADFGWHVRHGDVEGAIAALREVLSSNPDDLAQKGRRAQTLIARSRTRDVSCGRVCDEIEHAVIPSMQARKAIEAESTGQSRSVMLSGD